MRIFGIDPGLAILGWSFIDTEKTGKPEVQFGTVQTPSTLPLTQRLKIVYDDLNHLFELYRPQTLALETLFFVKNAKTLAQVGHTRGVILLLAGQKGLDVFEYAPKQIKLALTGFGGAEKKQMQLVVQRMLSLPTIPKPDDAADAVAVGLCHMQYSQRMGKSVATV